MYIYIYIYTYTYVYAYIYIYTHIIMIAIITIIITIMIAILIILRLREHQIRGWRAVSPRGSYGQGSNSSSFSSSPAVRLRLFRSEGHTCHILPPSEIDLGLFLAVFAGSGGK